MAQESDVVKVARAFRAQLAKNEHSAMQEMALHWVRMEQTMFDSYLAVSQEIKDLQDAGQPVSKQLLYNQRRYQVMLSQIQKNLADVDSTFVRTITAWQKKNYVLGLDSAKAQIKATKPSEGMWNEVAKDSAEIMAGFAGNGAPLGQLLQHDYGALGERVTDALVTGIGLGKGAYATARDIRDAVGMEFDRALRIARTETNRAYRIANADQYKASGVVEKVLRCCYPPTACLACLAMDGEECPNFICDDHPNGKCTTIAVTTGGHYPEWEKGYDWFEDQSEEDKRRIMGAERYEMYQKHGVDIRSFVTMKYNPVWGGSPTIVALKDLPFDMDKLDQAHDAWYQAYQDVQGYQFHTYHNIWKDDVTEADYEAKKSAIQAKHDYFKKKWLHAPAGSAEEKKWQDMLDLLSEFEQKGQQYEALKAQRDARLLDYLKLRQSQVNPQQQQTAPDDRFSQDRKNKAKWFKKSEYRQADAYYDPPARAVHATKTRAEHDAYYGYTDASGGYNRPLAGFRAPRFSGSSGWDERYYVGAGQVPLDHEGKGDAIRNLTALVGRSTYQDDVWVQTGQNSQFLEGFLGISRGSLQGMSDSDLQRFVGERRKIPQFISASINRGGGSYNPGDMVINIYAPSGSQMLYVLEDGSFGKREHEIIMQRGGTYEITRIYRGYDDNGNPKIFVDMDLHNEEGYDLFDK